MTALVLCAVTPFAVAFLAATLVVIVAGARAAGHRFAALRGLRVLRDRRRLAGLIGWVSVLCGIGVARVAIALAVCGIAPTAERVGIAFAAGGLYALLPTGPGAPAAATVTAAGTGAEPLAAGLLLAATTFAAVVVYALANLRGVRPPLGARAAQSQIRRAET